MTCTPRFQFFSMLIVTTIFGWLQISIPPIELQSQQGYRLPPQQVVEIIDVQPEPAVSFSPDSKWMLLIERNSMPSIADVSRRMLQLAGMRIDPIANARFATSFYRGLLLQLVAGGEAIRVPLPDGSQLSSVKWSHDSERFAFAVVTATGQQLWVAAVDDPENPAILTDRLSTVTVDYQWMPDGKELIIALVPFERGPEPELPSVPAGPNIQESVGQNSPTRTFQDLLSNPHDEALFEHYASSLCAIGHPNSIRVVSQVAIHDSIEVSPDGLHILVTTIRRPYSWLMPASSFPQTIEVRDVNGQLEYQLAEIPLAENIPIEGVRTGPRNVGWKPGEPATLIWTEALDGGDPQHTAEHRDRWMKISAPFEGEPAELVKIQHRAFGVRPLADPTLFTTTEYDRDKRWIRVLMHDLDEPESTPVALENRSIRDRYNDPGQMVTDVSNLGERLVRQDGDWVYLAGQGASPKGNLPFLRRQNLKTLEVEELWRCEEGRFESISSIVSSGLDKKPVVIISSETTTTPTNYFLLNLETGDRQSITDFKDPQPQIRGITKQIVTYDRADGVQLSATLYLPADYQSGQRLPLIVWAYPLEFNDAQTAAQISGSPSTLTTMRGITHLTLLTQGYAIMDNATMPVIGDPETMNDTFIEQIVSSAAAAIKKAVEMGVADPSRVGVGGHSYGAFMTANLLAHCDLFRAGIARSGAYNRTLTPFGFQSERRPIWEARDIYANISPFMHADKINEPILLIHGENDNNPGTFPIQSERMYQAIKGNGGTVRLVMLPAESHGYQARESVLQTQAEMIEWFDKYVKNVDVGHSGVDGR